MKKSFLGAISLALTLGMSSCEPAHADDSASCVTPDQISAEDQAEFAKDPRLAGYTSVVLAKLDGVAAKNAADMLIQIGAPNTYATVSVIVILGATPPEGKPEMTTRHVVGFTDGCKTEGGFVSATIAAALIGQGA